MENTTRQIITLLIIAFFSSCSNRTKNEQIKHSQEEIKTILVPNDTISTRIKVDSAILQVYTEIIKEILNEKKLGVNNTLEKTSNTTKLTFHIQEKPFMELTLTEINFDSENLAVNEINERKKYKEETLKENIFPKISIFSIRVNNDIYDLSSTENISHLRKEILLKFQNRCNVNQDNIVYW